MDCARNRPSLVSPKRERGLLGEGRNSVFAGVSVQSLDKLAAKWPRSRFEPTVQMLAAEMTQLENLSLQTLTGAGELTVHGVASKVRALRANVGDI